MNDSQITIQSENHRPDQSPVLERIEDILVPGLKNPRQAAVEHWTGVKVHGWIKEQLQVELIAAN